MICICVDDYGDQVYRCHWTGKPVALRDAKWTGSIVPGVRRVSYPAAPGYESIKKQSDIWFHESEQNCNTCKHLERVKRDKIPSGFLYGKCLNKVAFFEAHPYKNSIDRDVMMFHPDDYMGMPCYASRWSQES